eukprot:5007240-Pyramimonas_sp.AAC.1
MKQAPGALQTPFCRGLLPDPAQAFAYPSRSPARHFYDMDRKGVVHVEGGPVFTDGGGFYTDIPRMRSAGWSAVVCDHERRRVARYY